MLRSRGFSLIELLVTLMVAGILMAMAVPSFQSLMDRQQIKVTRQSLVDALVEARSLAISGMVSATLKPVNSNNSGDWSNGWELTVEGSTNDANTAATKTVRRYIPKASRLSVTEANSTADEIKFDYMGVVTGGSATELLVCPDPPVGGVDGKMVEIKKSGQIVLRDLSGNESC